MKIIVRLYLLEAKRLSLSYIVWKVYYMWYIEGP